MAVTYRNIIHTIPYTIDSDKEQDALLLLYLLLAWRLLQIRLRAVVCGRPLLTIGIVVPYFVLTKGITDLTVAYWSLLIYEY